MASEGTRANAIKKKYAQLGKTSASKRKPKRKT